MAYYGGPKDLKGQLVEFAARKLMAKAIDVAAKHAETKIVNTIQTRQFRRALEPRKKEHTMASYSENRKSAPQAAISNVATVYDKNEPVDFWVNTVIVKEDGGEPIRILTGRPLRVFKANKKVNTSNEDFNLVNATNNAFLDLLHEDAETLELGQSKLYSPASGKLKEGKLKAGIYLQLHREQTDHDAASAAKIDIEATEKASLRSLFGS